jgi:uracil-DNA glycosylase
MLQSYAFVSINVFSKDEFITNDPDGRIERNQQASQPPSSMTRACLPAFIAELPLTC